jgi:hypothetical protein
MSRMKLNPAPFSHIDWLTIYLLILGGLMRSFLMLPGFSHRSSLTSIRLTMLLMMRYRKSDLHKAYFRCSCFAL